MQAPQAATASPDPGQALGQAVWLMMNSPAHKHLFITDLEWLVTPPVALRQFCLWRRHNTPFAFASWAFLNEEAEQRLFTGQRRLGPGDWKAGDRLWLVDLVAPFGGAEEILNDLKNKAFPDREIKAIAPNKEGNGFNAVTLAAKEGSGE
jgi:cytolysin-activating lysine-acyltransferase